MNLRLDDRIGSKELVKLFDPHGVTPKVCRLEFGDIDFLGQGPHGECAICVERKTIGDLVASIQSDRLSGHQLPGMASLYDYAYLIVEGIWRPGADGGLEIRKGAWGAFRNRMSYQAVDNYLSTLEIKTGLIFRRTSTQAETVAVIVDLAKWWSKAWADHQSHDRVFSLASPDEGRKLHLARRKPSQVELVAMTLPGVDTKAKEVAKAFRTVKDMVLADERAWRAINGVGVIGAKRIMEALG
jgi:ERCC4-type nuclease